MWRETVMLFISIAIIILFVTSVDALATTLGLAGGGPIMRRVTNWLWAGFLTVHRRFRFTTTRFLQLGGSFILILTIHVWIGLRSGPRKRSQWASKELKLSEV